MKFSHCLNVKLGKHFDFIFSYVDVVETVAENENDKSKMSSTIATSTTLPTAEQCTHTHSLLPVLLLLLTSLLLPVTAPT